MPPPARGFAVETNALQTEAKIWQDESAAMDDIAKKADVLRFTDMGLYTVFIPKYHTFVDAFVARANEGKARMVEIHDTLNNIANLYEQSEERQSQRLRSSGQLNP